MTILSLGLGVQSSTILLMAKHGEIDRPDLAIFADTDDELPETYRWLRYLKKISDIEIVTVTNGSLSSSLIDRTNGYYIAIPTFGTMGGMGMRQCTDRFKIRPIRNYLRRLYGKQQKFEMMLGITTDEAQRMKDSPVKYIKNIYPLIEKGMSRSNCESWLRKNNYPQPPKSACIYCPFHKNSHWKEMKKREHEWNLIKAVDGKFNKEGKYLHNSLIPIDEIDFDSQTDFLGEFNNECEGYCGT